MNNKLGPIELKLINSDSARFYRFFYRRWEPSDEKDIYTIKINIKVKHVNLNEQKFKYHYTNNTELEEFLKNIVPNETNITDSNLLMLKNELRIFKNSDYNAVEIILPTVDKNEYNQNDITNIYNIAIEILGL